MPLRFILVGMERAADMASCWINIQIILVGMVEHDADRLKVAFMESPDRAGSM